jgi:signal transduction histidine kinase
MHEPLNQIELTAPEERPTTLGDLFSAHKPGQAKPPSAWARYGLVFVTTGIALAVSLALKALGEPFVALFFATVMLCSWYGGLGPGLLAAAFASFFANYVIFEAEFSMRLEISDLIRSIVFASEAILVSTLTVQRRRAEGSLQELNRHLDERVQRRTAALQESNQQLESFCYAIAHDLRAPLRSMQGFAQLLLEDHGSKLDGEGRDFAGRIAHSSERMGQLIKDLLDYVQLSRTEIHLRPVSLDEALAAALRQFAPDIVRKRAKVSVEAPLGVVMADPELMATSLCHLISNALKFVAPEVEPRIRIWGESREGKCRLWVEDNGIGIEPRYQERLFGVFERLNIDGFESGTGIGLAMLKKGMERLDGKAGVVSSPGQGSRFWIELNEPAERDQHPALEIPAGAPQEIQGNDRQPQLRTADPLLSRAGDESHANQPRVDGKPEGMDKWSQPRILLPCQAAISTGKQRAHLRI